MPSEAHSGCVSLSGQAVVSDTPMAASLPTFRPAAGWRGELSLFGLAEQDILLLDTNLGKEKKKKTSTWGKISI